VHAGGEGVGLEVVHEAGDVQANVGRVLDQCDIIEAGLVLEQVVVHFPELTLRTGGLRSLGGALEGHLVAADGAPVGRVEGKDNRPAAQVAQAELLVRRRVQLEIRRCDPGLEDAARSRLRVRGLVGLS
jgi:hypothetical protein